MGSLSIGNLLESRKRFRVIFLSLFIICVFAISPTVFAQNELSLTKTIDGSPATVETGEIITIRLTFACNNLTGPCGALTITDILDSNLIHIQTQVPPGYTAAFDGGTNTVTITHPNFLDGSQGEALIIVQVDHDTANAGAPVTITNDATGTITTPPLTVTTPPVSFTVPVPTEQWDVVKTKVIPTIDPALDNDVVYTVSVCSTTEEGNVSLTGVTLTDTLPPDVVIIDAGGGTVSGGNPQTITWTLGDLDVAVYGNGGCESRSVVIQYPSAFYTTADTPTNNASATGSYLSSVDVPIGMGDVTHGITTPEPNPASGKRGPSSPVGMTGVGRFFLDFNSLGANVPITDVIYTDNLPPELEVTEIQTGNWTPTYVTAVVEYSVNNGVSWTPIPGGPFDGDDDVTFTAPVTTITNVRWIFSYVDPFVGGPPIAGVPLGFTTGGGGSAPEIVFSPRDVPVVVPPLPAAVPGSTYTNCAVLTSTGNPPQTNCADAEIAVNTANLATSKAEQGGPTFNPSDQVTFDLTVTLTERSSAPLIDLFVQDVLPPQFTFVSFDGIAYNNIPVAEQPATPPTFTQVGQTLTWDWGVAGWTLPHTDSGGIPVNKTIVITYTVEINAGTPPAGYDNTVTFVTDSNDVICEGGGASPDGADLDGDADTTETTCVRVNTTTVQPAVVLNSEKWIVNPTFPGFLDSTDLTNPAPVCPTDLGSDGFTYTRFPCVALGHPDNPANDFDDFKYRMVVNNSGNVDATEYIMYDILPYIGDTGSGGPLVGTPRNSEFQPFMTGPLVIGSLPPGVVAGDLNFEYSLSTNPCRDEVFGDSGPPLDEPAGCVNDWTPAPADFTLVRAFRIFLDPGAGIPPLGTMEIFADMRINANGDAALNANSGEIAWNSFAQRATNGFSGSRIPTSEPRIVGIMVPERLSIGNRVWYDINNNDLIDATEVGVPGVTVSLYEDSAGGGPDGVPDGPAIATDTTTLATGPNGAGYYLFDDLDPGTYIVGVDASNFGPGQPLEFWVSTTDSNPDNETDNDDNGINTLGPNGILSPTIDLTIDSEPTSEAAGDLSMDPTDGPVFRGNTGEANNNSDLTVDFGFRRPMSIGNRVWLDEGSPTGTRNDGTQDGTEPGISGVVVNLYLDANTDGIAQAGEFVATDTTDGGGYYLFDDLGEGDYIVEIPASEFGVGEPLFNHASSVGNDIDNFDDQDDNGIDDVAYVTNGIFSPVIVFDLTAEPTGETDLSGDPGDGPIGQSRGTNGELDENSNLTVDFGFYIPRLSVGNRVWLDLDDSGLIDAPDGATPGLGGVTVSLYADADSNGIPDTPPAGAVATDTTDAEGYYLFDDLTPGTYVIAVDIGNFAGGAVLEEYESSTGVTGDTQTDNNDNGNDAFDVLYGILSDTITLTIQQEPAGEADLSNDAGDGPAGERRGNQGQLDIDSDLTIDFGFYKPMSIGNRVWLDNGVGGGIRNNGLQDGGELGIGGVLVTLYLDDGDGVFEPGAGDTPVPGGTDTTDAEGYYLFDNLPPGQYFVWVNDTNFQAGGPLEPYDSSLGNGIDDGTDQDDNGVDDNFPATNGIVSVPILLEYDMEPTLEADLSNDAGDGPVGERRGVNGESDDNSDLTVDFGFDVPVFSIGNRVWYDANNSGTIDAEDGATPGIAGITVFLFADSAGGGPDGVPDGPPIATDVTNAEGYYLFDNLAPGTYIVGIDELEFRIGGDLVDYFSSTPSFPDDGTESDDNGINSVDPQLSGIISPTITLAKNAEPITETDPSGDPTDGPTSIGNNGEINSNSDISIDFGVYKPMSIGNRVWFDTNDSGTIDGVETGAPGVTVNLYRDDNGNGIFEPAELFDTDVTDADGYYLFDNVIFGDYVVEIPATQFQAGGPLVGLMSSTLDSTNDGDSNDNGINDPAPDVNGIFSNVIDMALDGQPTVEPDLSGDPGDGPGSIGNFGETDENSDITVDFGFIVAEMSLGNRVWLDPNNSGDIDAADGTTPGIGGVTVSLYRDVDTDGIPDGPAIRTDTTDADGYYIFDALAPGDYIVGLDNSNFSGGGALNGLISSTGNGVDDQTDSDDNGIDTLDVTFGLLSSTINLTMGAEITTEADLGPEGDGTNGETPDNSELTVDFGLYEPLAIGNRVWFDPDDSGTINGSEAGVGGVLVNLYRDDNNDNIPDAGELLATDTTDVNGYYIFDGLGIGDYIVEVDPTNFDPGGPLEGSTSSTLESTNNADNNDNGINDPAPATNGIRSNLITLTPNTAPTNDNDLGPEGHGANGEADNDSNLSVDFGFLATPMSFGNRVWFDDGTGGGTARDGTLDGGEVGAPNVDVSLYFDNDADGVPDGPAIATDTTDAGGYYLFDGLTPGNYIVGLDDTNFQPAGALAGYTSTTDGAVGTDSNDNGLDNPNPPVNGILSATVNLQLTTEPLGEADLSGDPGDGPGSIGNNGETDDNSDITVDFGVYKPMSLGNRVWFDPDDSGTINGTETGIAGVAVSLYEDSAGGVPDGVPDGPAIATDITDSNGYYLFDNLDPGTYLVGVDASNFAGGGALVGFTSSTGDTNDDTDSNDNGIDGVGPSGILSDTVTLVIDNAPTGEADLSGDAVDGPNFRGTNGESDNNSDLTIDFGFVAGAMSIGNRVWLDDGTGGGTPDDGTQDGGELGVGGVLVNLYADTDSDGVPDGLAITTDTTDADGYYLFDGLPPGNYLVQVDPSNFQAGNPLFGYFSSTFEDPTTTADSNDNGINNPDPAGNGIFSQTIPLVANSAPTGETDLGPDGNGSNGETDDNSNQTIDFGFIVSFDLGDAPDSYGTLNASNGPRHQIVPTLFLGTTVDDEGDGQPSAGADGDDTGGADDEDGVDIPPSFVAGTTIDLEVTVFNDTGSSTNFVGWIDWDGSGTFDPGDAVTATVPSDPNPQVIQVPVTVPIDADVTTGGTTYARFRLTTDPITTGDPVGPAGDGEIEDYLVTVTPPGVAITKTDGQNSIVAGQATTYTIALTNSGLDVTNANFTDSPPVADPDGFDPATITWTCTATAGASCISGQPAGTGSTGSGAINEFIDLPRDSMVTYQLTATLRANYSAPTVVNTATLGGAAPVSASDTNGVITDPPSGRKIGVAINGTLIRWTMVWENTGPLQVATITDRMRSGQTFAGNLTCTAFGTSITTSCTFAGNTVTWDGTIGTGNPNRVEISFDVSVAGNNSYTNVGTIDVGGNTANASASVTVGTPPVASALTPTPDPSGPPPQIVDPAIVKLGDPAFAQPGETVIWTIEVSNPNGVSINNVGFVDNMPPQLTILSVSATAGNVSFNGQTVTFNIPTLNAGQTVLVQVVTELQSTDGLVSVTNVATLNEPYTGLGVYSLFFVSELPATGESPWGIWRDILILSSGLLLVSVAGARLHRRRTAI